MQPSKPTDVAVVRLNVLETVAIVSFMWLSKHHYKLKRHKLKLGLTTYRLSTVSHVTRSSFPSLSPEPLHEPPVRSMDRGHSRNCHLQLKLHERMKIQLITVAVVLALASSNIEAQTLGDSVVSGNDNGAAMVTDSVADSTVGSTTTDSTATTDNHSAGHTGLTTSSTESSGISSDDSYTTTASSTDDSTSIDAGSDDTSSSTDAATSQSSAESTSGSSDAPRTVLAAGVSLVAVAVAAML